MDKLIYENEFISFKDELKSFLFRLVTNKSDVEDLIQDTYIKVFDKLDSFEQRSSFKTWVFTIGLNLSKNHLSKQKRWLENSQDYGAKLHTVDNGLWETMREVFDQTPDKIYEIKEHIVYCFNCINKTLETNQQISILLKEVYGFKVNEIMQITGLTEGIVKHAIADARKNMIRIFDNRCSFVNQNGVCHQCSVLKGNLNPKQNAEIEAVKIKMVKEGNNPDKEHLLNLRLDLVKNVNPIDAPNSIVNIYMLENNEKWVKEGMRRKVLGEADGVVASGCE